MEARLINANDPVLWRLSVVKGDGHRYIPWEALAEVPTVKLVQRRGEWRKYHSYGIHAGPGVVCSRCDSWNNRKKNYCPCCGARMDGFTDDFAADAENPQGEVRIEEKS